MGNNYIPFETKLNHVILVTNDKKYHHIYEKIEKKDNENDIKKLNLTVLTTIKTNKDLVSENWPCYYINSYGQLSTIGSNVPPQLPPRNQKAENDKIRNQIDYSKNKINDIDNLPIKQQDIKKIKTNHDL